MEEKQTKKLYRKEFSKLGFIMLAITALFIGAQYLAIYLLYFLAPNLYESGSWRLLIQMLPVYLLVMPFGMWLLGRMPNVKPEKHSVKPGQFLVMIPMAYCLIIITNYIGNIITMLIGNLKGAPVNNDLLDLTMSLNPLLSLAIVGIWGPIMEELLFRKALAGALLRFGEGTAILLSALAFAFFHGNLNQFVYAFTLGLFLAFLYVKTGNIKITIGLHIIVNSCSGVLATELLKLSGYMELAQIMQEGDQNALMEFVSAHMAGLLLFVLYAVVIFALTITGVILFLVHRKKFGLRAGEIVIPKGQRFGTMFLNVGVILYCVFWAYQIVMQLLA